MILTRYCLIMLATTWCVCVLTAQDEGPFVTYLRIQTDAIFASVTLRRLVLATGVLLVAALVWQLVGLDFAFMIGGEVMTYLEIVVAVFLVTARTRIRRMF